MNNNLIGQQPFDWHAVVAMAVGMAFIGFHILGVILKQKAKAQKAEQQRMNPPLDRGGANQIPTLTPVQEQSPRERIQAAMRAKLEAMEKQRRAEMVRLTRAQQAAKQQQLARRQQQQFQAQQPRKTVSSAPTPIPPKAAPRRQTVSPPAAARSITPQAVPAIPVGNAARSGPFRTRGGAGVSLRDAMIWREILDRPIAMREPGELV